MTTINLSDAKDRLSKLVKETSETTEPVLIAVHGRKEAVLISLEEYDALRETIEILRDQKLVKQIHASMQDIKKGAIVRFDEIRRAS